MAVQTPGKYKKGCSYRRKCVISQRLRRAREKREKEGLTESHNSKYGNRKTISKRKEGRNVTVAILFTSLSRRALFQKNRRKMTLGRNFKKLSTNALLGKDLIFCKNLNNASINVPLSRNRKMEVFNKLPINAKGTQLTISNVTNIPSISVLSVQKYKITVGRVFKMPFSNALLGNKLVKHPSNVLLGTKLTTSNDCDIPSMSVPSGRKGEMTVGRLFEKPSANALLGNDLINPKVFNTPSLRAVLNKNGEAGNCVFNEHSASVLLGNSLTASRVADYQSLSSLLGRRGNLTLVCRISKPSPSSKQPTKKKQPAKKKNVTIQNISDCASAAQLDEIENVTLASVPPELPFEEKILPLESRHATRNLRPIKNKDFSEPSNVTSNADFSEPSNVTSNADFNNEQEANHMTLSSQAVSIDLSGVSPSKTVICNEVNTEQWLNTEQQYKNHVISENKFPSGRFICDLKSVIRQAREIESHSAKCKFRGKLTYYRTMRDGLVNTFYYSCSSPNCGASMKLVTDSDGQNLNRLAVLGAVSTGSGFSQEEQKFKMMNLEYMSKAKYLEYYQSGWNVAKCANKATMTEAVTVDHEVPQPKFLMDFCIDET